MLQAVILEQGQVLEVNMSITKKDIAKNITSKALLDNKTSKEVLDNFIKLVKLNSTHSDIKIAGFGTFINKVTPERMGRNPKTGEEIPISARRVVTFRPGQKLKARVEAYARNQ